ncbi:MAG: AgmX/PglI C-terminal domain-containing protein [Myxococcaceae bacterium]|nr:AgmX/PglI C-terminal domain-containing protein [Myxococcaceae bacterium]
MRSFFLLVSLLAAQVLAAGKAADAGAAAPKGEGTIDKELVRKVVTQHAHEVRACYQKELEANPKFHGKLVVSFVIGLKGEVQWPKVASSDLPPSPLDDCVIKTVAKWSFPPPTGGTVSVSYPFILVGK